MPVYSYTFSMKLKANQIPKSFQSYIDQFETDPDVAIERLSNHVTKRNTGAVGYFFLAWLYYKNNQPEPAVENALMAKVHAPGSILMDHLHYFLLHPKNFQAWEPTSIEKTSQRRNQDTSRSHPIHDLDSLINKLSSIEKKRIKPNFSDTEELPDLSAPSSNVDDIVSETLASIHEKQNNIPAAIATFKKLRKLNPSRKEYYDEQIFRLQQLQEERKK